MTALLAAQAAAARDPPRRAPVDPAPARPAEEADEIPRYRRSRIFEVLLFLFATPVWGAFAVTDKTRGAAMRIFGGAMFALFGGLVVLQLKAHLLDGSDEESLSEAVRYAAAVANVAGDYALANQRVAERTASIDLPANRPDTIEAVHIGQGGRIRVTFGQNLRKAPGGYIEFTPVVENGEFRWSCRSEGIALGYNLQNCD